MGNDVTLILTLSTFQGTMLINLLGNGDLSHGFVQHTVIVVIGVIKGVDGR